MADFNELQNSNLWQKSCLLFKAIHEVVSLCEFQDDLESLSRQVSRLTAEAILASSDDARNGNFLQALELIRKADHVLYALAADVYQTVGCGGDNSVYEKMIRAFVYADQLKELIFHELQHEFPEKRTA